LPPTIRSSESPLDLELLEAAVDERATRFFERLGIDDELPVRALLLLKRSDRSSARSGRCWARSLAPAFSSALTAATSR